MTDTTAPTLPDWYRNVPTTPGWYRTADAADWLLYSLAETGQWFAHVLNGDVVACEWDYIAQAGPVELLTAYPRQAAGK